MPWDPQVCRVSKESRVIRVIRALVVPEVFREFPDQLGLQLEWLDLGERRVMPDRRVIRVTPVLKAFQASRETRVMWQWRDLVATATLDLWDPVDLLDPWDPLDRRVIWDPPEQLPWFLET